MLLFSFFLGYEFVVGTNVLDHNEWIFQKSGVRVAWREYMGGNLKLCL